MTTPKNSQPDLAPIPESGAAASAARITTRTRILGAHEYGDHTVIRALRPHALEVAALVGGRPYPLTHVDSGLFAVALPFTDLIDYRLEVSYPGADADPYPTVADGYRFLPTLGELDLHLFGEGRHERLWDILGAHPRPTPRRTVAVTGTSFAVWAPNAQGVTLVGDFDGWAGNDAPMRALGSTGVWELFWPGFRRRRSTSSASTAPTARSPTRPTRWPSPPRCRRRPRRVVTASTYTWDDADWLTPDARLAIRIRADERLRGPPRRPGDRV